MFSFFQTLGKIIKNMNQTNIIDLVISLIALPTLLLFKHINQKYKKKLRNIPIPVEFFLIIIATTLSHLLEWGKKGTDVAIVDSVPLGFVFSCSINLKN